MDRNPPTMGDVAMFMAEKNRDRLVQALRAEVDWLLSPSHHPGDDAVQAQINETLAGALRRIVQRMEIP